MRTAQGFTLATLRAVDAFIDANAGALPSTAASGKRQLLKKRLADIEHFKERQVASSDLARGMTGRIGQLRKQLVRQQMAEIARVARDDLPDTPEMAAFRIPARRISAERVIAAARGMAEAARHHAGVFTAAGLSPSFIDELSATIDALQSALDRRRQHSADGGGATRNLKDVLVAARRTMDVLDMLVRRDLRDNPTLLEKWISVKRTVRSGTGGVVTPEVVVAPAA